MVPTGTPSSVAMLSAAVARELGLAPEDVNQVEYAAYLHDIGAINKARRAGRRAAATSRGARAL